LLLRIFDQARGQNLEKIYGGVTTGSLWQFMQLSDNKIEVDLDQYFLKDLGKILGILHSFVDQSCVDQGI
jgi:hypothetical protein